MNKLISIIIPCYNDEFYINNMINSLLNQSFNDYEIIFVDDGSSDKSYEKALNKLKVLESSKYKVIKQENQGVSEARNTGIKHATGKYLYFLDADDYIDKDLFKKVKELDDKKSFDMFFFRFKRFNSEKVEHSKEWIISENKVDKVLKNILINNFNYCMCSIFIRREIIVSNNISFTKGAIYGEDSEFIIKALCNSNSIELSNYIGFYYRVNNDSITKEFDLRRIDSVEAALRVEKYISESRFKESFKYFAKGYVAKKIYYNLQRIIETKYFNNTLTKYDKNEFVQYLNKNRKYLKYFKYEENSDFKIFIIRNIAVIDIRIYIKVYKGYRLNKNKRAIRNEVIKLQK